MKSIKIDKLDLIESLFSEDLVFQSEQLLDSNDFVVNFDEGEKVCTASNKDFIVNVEKRIFDKLEYRCNCEAFDMTSECPHVLLTLLLYRSHLSDHRKLKIAATKKRKNSQKLVDVGIILENIDNAELSNFLKSYANKDRKFSIALKTRFAHKVELPDNALKYKQILDSILSPVSKREEKVKITDLKQLCRVISELCQQSQDLISLNQLVEATDILMVLSNKWEYTKFKQISDINLYTQVQNELYQTWYLLASKTIAPALKAKIYNFFKDLISKTYFRPYDTIHNHGEIALLFIKNDQVRLLELSEKLKEVYNKTNEEKPRAWMMSLSLRFDNTLIDKYLDDLLNTPNLIPIVLERLIELKSYTLSKAILEELLKNEPESLKLFEKYLDVALGIKDWKLAIKVTAKLCQKTKRLFFYKKTRECIPASYIELLLKGVLKSLNLDPNRDNLLKMSIYHYEDKWSEILEYSYEFKDFKILEKYASFLNEHAQAEFSLTYVQLFDDYLENHLGEKANEFVKETLDKLRRARCTHTADTISNFIKNKFPARLEN